MGNEPQASGWRSAFLRVKKDVEAVYDKMANYDVSKTVITGRLALIITELGELARLASPVVSTGSADPSTLLPLNLQAAIDILPRGSAAAPDKLHVLACVLEMLADSITTEPWVLEDLDVKLRLIAGLARGCLVV